LLLGTLAGCAAYLPPVVTTSQNPHLDLSTLQRGRVLFAQHCIECHTLPPVHRYSRDEWPHIVNSMAERASLRRSERDAILAYILAAQTER